MEVIPSASGIDGEYELAALPLTLRRTLSNIEIERLRRYADLPMASYREACPTCKQTGSFNTRLHDGTVVRCRCNCLEQWMLTRLLRESGIGNAYQRYSWNHVRAVNPEALETVRLYLSRLDEFIAAGIGLILWSERNGTGKSLLSSLVLKEAMARGHSVYYTTLVEMADHHTASWSDKEHREWFQRRICGAKVVVIDEWGKENPGRANVIDELLDKVIRSRVANNRPTILPTNLRPDQSGDVGGDFSRYQAALMDLLVEQCLQVEVSGQSYRSRVISDKINDMNEQVVYPVVIR